MFSRILVAFSIALLALAAPRPIEITDIFGWKRIQAPNVSNDGAYFAYRVVPNEGDSELVIRNLKDSKETRFPIGEVIAAGGGGGGRGPGGPSRESGVTFSEDGKWLAFQLFPKRADSRKSKRDKKPAFNQVTLVELATGKKQDFDKVKAFAFNGERGGWIALHKYTTDAQDKEPPATKWQGSDLLLHQLSTGDELNIGNVSEFAFNKPGTYLAFTIDASEKTGNGLQIRDMATGAVVPIDSAKASYKSISWTDKGDAVAVLKGFDDKTLEDKLYRVVGAKDLTRLTSRKLNSIPPPACRSRVLANPAGLKTSPRSASASTKPGRRKGPTRRPDPISLTCSSGTGRTSASSPCSRYRSKPTATTAISPSTGSPRKSSSA